MARCLLLLPLIVLAASCGSKEGSISGKVTYKGKAVTGGEIRFYPEVKGKSNNFATEIGSDGSYTILKVPPGPAKVSVTTSSSGPPMEMMRGMGGNRIAEGMKKQKEKLKEKGANEGQGVASRGPTEMVGVPEKYNDPEKSNLKMDVKAGKQTQNFDLD